MSGRRKITKGQVRYLNSCVEHFVFKFYEICDWIRWRYIHMGLGRFSRNLFCGWSFFWGSAGVLLILSSFLFSFHCSMNLDLLLYLFALCRHLNMNDWNLWFCLSCICFMMSIDSNIKDETQDKTTWSSWILSLWKTLKL